MRHNAIEAQLRVQLGHAHKTVGVNTVLFNIHKFIFNFLSELIYRKRQYPSKIITS